MTITDSSTAVPMTTAITLTPTGGPVLAEVSSVAAAAGTSKTVLYRRWDTKVEMVMSAMVDVAREVLSVPDTGSLSTDLHTILVRMRARLTEIGSETIRSLLADLPVGSTDALLRLITSHVDDVMAPTLERARERGELGPGALAPRAAALPFDLSLIHI